MVRFYHISTVIAFLSVSKSLAQVTFLTQPEDATITEGGNATFQCAAVENGMALLFAWDFIPKGGMLMTVINGTPVAGVSRVTVSGDRTQLTLSGVQREVDAATVICTALGSTSAVGSNPATVSVQYPPTYSLLPNQPSSLLEGENFTYSFGLDAKPIPTNITWSRDGQVIFRSVRIATSVSAITIASTTRTDSGAYEVVSYNEAGQGGANFTLDVQFPPELTTPLTPPLLTTGTSFSFNCTPSAANPPVDTVSIEVDGSPVTSGDTVTVTDNVLTIPLVQRSHSGNYSCTATNTAGSAVIYQYLQVADGVPLIAQVAVQFTASSSLEVVTHLTTNGGRDILRYFIVLNGVAWIFSGASNQFVLSATVSGDPSLRGEEEGEEWSVSVVVENALGNSSKIVLVLQSQPLSVSDSLPVTDRSSVVIGLSVTVALVIVTSVIIVVGSLAVIIFLCQRQALYRVKVPSSKEGDYQLEEVKEVKLESNPAYEAVNTS